MEQEFDTTKPVALYANVHYNPETEEFSGELYDTREKAQANANSKNPTWIAVPAVVKI